MFLPFFSPSLLILSLFANVFFHFSLLKMFYSTILHETFRVCRYKQGKYIQPYVRSLSQNTLQRSIKKKTSWVRYFLGNSTVDKVCSNTSKCSSSRGPREGSCEPGGVESGILSCVCVYKVRVGAQTLGAAGDI